MFVYKYVETFDHREAAEAVGLKAGSGIHVLRRPLVAAFLEEVQEVYQSRSLVSADFVRMQMLKLLPMLMGEEEVACVDAKEGVTFMAKKFHSADAVRLVTELGKTTKIYEEGSGGEKGAVTVNVNLAALGIEEKDITTTIEGELEK
jgi:hypothetical protein